MQEATIAIASVAEIAKKLLRPSGCENRTENVLAAEIEEIQN